MKKLPPEVESFIEERIQEELHKLQEVQKRHVEDAIRAMKETLLGIKDSADIVQEKEEDTDYADPLSPLKPLETRLGLGAVLYKETAWGDEWTITHSNKGELAVCYVVRCNNTVFGSFESFYDAKEFLANRTEIPF